MTRYILVFSLIIVFSSCMQLLGKPVNKPVMVIYKASLLKFIPDPDSTYSGAEWLQDTLPARRKIKEIAPARPQPKPERIIHPAQSLPHLPNKSSTNLPAVFNTKPSPKSVEPASKEPQVRPQRVPQDKQPGEAQRGQ